MDHFGGTTLIHIEDRTDRTDVFNLHRGSQDVP